MECISSETLDEVKTLVCESSGQDVEPKDIKVLQARCPVPGREWSCFITLTAAVQEAQLPYEMPIDNIASTVLENIKNYVPDDDTDDWFNHSGIPMEQIYLSRSDFRLIEPGSRVTFKDGEILYVNHVKRAGNWKTILSIGHLPGSDNATCGWCFWKMDMKCEDCDKVKKEIRCGDCDKVAYCSIEHKENASYLHSLLCKPHYQILVAKE